MNNLEVDSSVLPKIAKTVDESRIGGTSISTDKNHSVSLSLRKSSVIEGGHHKSNLSPLDGR